MCASSSASSSTGARPRRRDAVHWLPLLLAAAWAGGIWWLSSRSFSGMAGSGPLWRMSSNLLHFPLFGIWAVLWAETFRRGGTLERAVRLRICLLVLAYGVIDELHQGTVPGRHQTLADVATDGLGAVGFLALWWGLRGPGERQRAWRDFLLVGLIAAAAVALREFLP